MKVIFKTYLSFLPMCLGAYHVVAAKHDITTSHGIFMTILGWLLMLVYGYYFTKWLHGKLKPFINKKQ